MERKEVLKRLELSLRELTILLEKIKDIPQLKMLSEEIKRNIDIIKEEIRKEKKNG